MKRFIPIVLLLSVATAQTSRIDSQSLSGKNLDSLARIYFLEISKLESPELAERRRVRRELQRKCYADVLSYICAEDGLSAAFSLLRGSMQIEFSMSHRPIAPSVPQNENGQKLWDVPEIDDWTFPADPWEKKK